MLLSIHTKQNLFAEARSFDADKRPCSYTEWKTLWSAHVPLIFARPVKTMVHAGCAWDGTVVHAGCAWDGTVVHAGCAWDGTGEFCVKKQKARDPALQSFCVILRQDITMAETRDFPRRKKQFWTIKHLSHLAARSNVNLAVLLFLHLDDYLLWMAQGESNA